MTDKQLFIDKFNEIIKETMKDYPPEEREIKVLHGTFDSIIQSWDLDMRDHGIDYQISYFKKNADEIDKALIKQKANLHPGIALKVNKKGRPLPPDNNPQSYRISIAFLLSSLLKVDRFIIEYLEGLKSKLVEDSEFPIKPKFTPWQIALMAHYEGKVISRKSAADYLKEIGMDGVSPNSLYNDFCVVRKQLNRVNTEDTDVKTANKITRFEAIIPFLSQSARKEADRDLKTLRSKL